MPVPQEIRAAVLEGLTVALTEQRTDALAEAIANRFPWWLRPFARRALDRLLPEWLISEIDTVMRRF